jgi:hypothetical protein
VEPINTNMKRVIAITAAAVMACSSLAWAQSTKATAPQTATKSLADVAKEEEARRQAVRKPAKVYTNGSLPTGSIVDTPPPPAASTPSTTDKPAANSTPGSSAAAPKPGEVKDQAYWADRMKAAREQLDRSQLFADSLQTRINSLWTDFVNRDDPAQKAKLETERKAALAELERVKKEIEQQTKAITALEDEARRAGVPPGWVRPGA